MRLNFALTRADLRTQLHRVFQWLRLPRQASSLVDASDTKEGGGGRRRPKNKIKIIIKLCGLGVLACPSHDERNCGNRTDSRRSSCVAFFAHRFIHINRESGRSFSGPSSLDSTKAVRGSKVGQAALLLHSAAPTIAARIRQSRRSSSDKSLRGGVGTSPSVVSSTIHSKWMHWTGTTESPATIQ